jgi:hypothetical protein
MLENGFRYGSESDLAMDTKCFFLSSVALDSTKDRYCYYQLYILQ